MSKATAKTFSDILFKFGVGSLKIVLSFLSDDQRILDDRSEVGETPRYNSGIALDSDSAFIGQKLFNPSIILALFAHLKKLFNCF